MENPVRVGDVVVIVVRGKPRLALYVGASPSGASHVVREGERERLVQPADLVTLSRQP
jgi:hypothetical protein